MSGENRDQLDAARWRAVAKVAVVHPFEPITYPNAYVLIIDAHVETVPAPTPDEYADALIALSVPVPTKAEEGRE